MQLNDFLKLAAAGAIITTGSSLLALFIKDFFLTRYFEDRREKKSLDNIFRKFKDPITLSSIEISSRLIEIHRNYPTVYLTEELLKLNPTSLITNSINDEHYRKHKLISTIYRLCSFFGWLELYRQEITFLNGSNNKTNKKLEKCLLNIRSTFADGQLNSAKDWNNWKDFLIFREEQRAIGENMITSNDKTRTIIGYAKFKLLMEEFLENRKINWLNPALNFFLNLNLNKDFRKTRYYLLIGHFQELLEALDKTQSKETLTEIKANLMTRL